MAYRGQDLGAGGAGAADTLVGNALLLCNCLATALYVICVKLALARGYPPSTITAWSYACGAVMMVRLAHAHALTLTYGPMRPLTSPCNTATPHCSTGHPCSPAHPTHIPAHTRTPPSQAGLASGVSSDCALVAFVCPVADGAAAAHSCGGHPASCAAWAVPRSAYLPLVYWVLLNSCAAYWLITWGTQHAKASFVLAYCALQAAGC